MSNAIDIGIVADWLVAYAGAEKVIKEFIDLYPGSELYSVVDFLSDTSREQLHNKKAKTTFIQKLPFSKTKYQKYLPFMPLAIEQLDLSSHEVILSSSHAVAKGVLTGPDQLHISYVHSPIRYAWDLQHQYLQEAKLNNGVKGLLAKLILHKIRVWDYRTANGVDHFVANSKFISRRIKKVYGRHSDVIYPPVDVERFLLNENKLVVIGDGSEMTKIKSKATKNIEILGYQENSVMQNYMRNAKAFVFAAEEDFGITPVEAQACGTPVIAYGKGGALETIRPIGVDMATGIFFHKQDVASIIEAVSSFNSVSEKLEPNNCRKNAVKFSRERFQNEMKIYVEKKWEVFKQSKMIEY